MTIANEFTFGETVYLKSDKDQLPRIITGLMVRPGSVLYYLSSSTHETLHYGIEISKDKDIILSTTG